ncbi:MAG TPA: patatin family protein [Polyangiales bacterium]|nr:patatin family protein [Polyangiales bacterium]
MTARTALVVEGGAMRGIFASGVLEVFQEQGFQPFDLAIGCSVGSCILASHLAGHRGRTFTVFTRYMTRREFIDPRRFIRGGDWVDFDWLWHATERDVPLDCAKLTASPVKLVVSTTSYTTGGPVFLEPGESDLMQALKSSCALPLLCRSAAHVGEQRLLDGGISAPIPVQEAYRRGARRIIVLRSRPAGFIKRKSSYARLAALAFRASPPLARALRSSHVAYRNAVEFITNPPDDCTILQVAPLSNLATGRTTQSTRALALDFALGREAGERAIRTWQSSRHSRTSAPTHRGPPSSD